MSDLDALTSAADKFFFKQGGVKAQTIQDAPTRGDDSLASGPQQPAPPPAAPALPGGESSLAAPQPSTPQQPLAGNSLDALTSASDQFFKPDRLALTSVSGSSPELAIPESPLSIAQQALLGWNRTPEYQIKQLKSEFPDAKLIMNGDEGQLAVKDKDGKWKLATPDFSWKGLGKTIASAAMAPGLPDPESANTSNALGTVARDVGEYGLRTAAASAAGLAAVASLPVSAPLAATVGAATLAGAAGAAGTEWADQASRRAAGAELYHDPEAAQHAINMSALYGALQEFGGQTMPAVLGKAEDMTAKALGLFTQSPEGRLAARQILSKIPGQDSDMLIEARLRNPMRAATTDKIAAQEAVNPNAPSKLGKMEDLVLDTVHGNLQLAKQRAGAEFASLASDPEVKSSIMDLTKSTGDTLNTLQERGFLSPDNKGINLSDDAPPMTDNDKQALRILLSRSKYADGMTYDQARTFASRVSDAIGNVDNKTLKWALTQLKEGVHQDIASSLPDAAASRYGDIMNKYAESANWLEKFEGMNPIDRKESFIKALTSEDQNAARRMRADLQNVGVDGDLFDRLLEIQSSKGMASIYAKKGNWFTKMIPDMRGGAVRTVANWGATRDPAVMSTLPYTDQAFRVLRALPADVRSQVLTNPQALNAIAQHVQNGAALEKGTLNQLLQKAGINGQ